MRHRIIRGLVTVPLLALAVASCVAGPDEPSGDGSGQGGQGGMLRVAVVSQPDSLNPVRGSTIDGDVWGAMFDPLAVVDEENRLTEEGLLVGWEQVD